MGNIASPLRYDAAALTHARTREYATACDLVRRPLGSFPASSRWQAEAATGKKLSLSP
jgi:hypothetical protein